MLTRMRLAACVAALGTAFALPARGQGLSPTDEREAARFAAMVRAAEQAGYAQPVVVGHGDGAADALFVLLATREGHGVLIAQSEPAGGGRAQPVELERAPEPADLGVRGLRFAAFLGTPGLVDVVVGHEPFTLESSRRFETHHVLRRRGARLEAACEFPGDATSSASKGIGSITSTRRVTVARIAGGPAPGFRVTTTDETAEQANHQATPVSTARRVSSTSYDLPAAGVCVERRGGPSGRDRRTP
jgi:hypothetical protein